MALRLRTKIKHMDPIVLIEYLIILVVFIVGLILLFGAGGWALNEGPKEVKPTKQIDWNLTKHQPAVPKEDTDGDTLSNIEENYKYGTNETNPDTDGDGMDDKWEVDYGVKNGITGKWSVDPNDPTDAYNDPDNDGYDFNHNGVVDTFYDSIFLSRLKVPPNTDYKVVTVDQLVNAIDQYNGQMVRVEMATVVDNGSYLPDPEISASRGDGPFPERNITVEVRDFSSEFLRVKVYIEPYGNRPVRLSAPANDSGLGGDLVDVQGYFRKVTDTEGKIVVRGGEHFTNLMEYITRADYDNDGRMNETDPNNADTDTDGMNDGWEVYYGDGNYNVTDDGRTIWEWIIPIDPTWPGDANIDLDGDAIEFDGRMRGNDYDEYLWGTNPASPDTDRDSFDINFNGVWDSEDTNANDPAEVLFYGTDPNNADTDGDWMSDGWEIYYGLNATNFRDRFDDPDRDRLTNYDEFFHATHPKRPDTDDDGMPDGWEVRYGLDPNSHRPGHVKDAWLDSDRNKAGYPSPDGLKNIQEYWNSTDPTNPDTDGDKLSDYNEIVVGWGVTVTVDRLTRTENYFTCATDADTDHDDILDDEDGDGYKGADEIFLEGNVTEEYGMLPEYDLNDYMEIYVFRTNASNPDTDGDNLTDAEEVVPAAPMTQARMDLTRIDSRSKDPEPYILTLPDNLQPIARYLHSIDRHKSAGILPTLPYKDDTDDDSLVDGVEVHGLYLLVPGKTDRVPRMIEPWEPDTDGDGLSDGDEALTDFDPVRDEFNERAEIRIVSGYVNRANTVTGYFPDYTGTAGSDADRPTTLKMELFVVNSTDPLASDTDGDGMEDGYEFDYSDLDKDGLPTYWERNNALGRLNPTRPDTDNNGIPDSMEDMEGDGVSNLDEFTRRMDPVNSDTNGNGIMDSREPLTDAGGYPILLRQPMYGDTDGDLMPDWWEIIHGLDQYKNDSRQDKDGDGLANLDEYLYHTNVTKKEEWSDPSNPSRKLAGGLHAMVYSPYAVDSDGDGMGDWWEIYYFGSTANARGDDNPDNSYAPDGTPYGDNWTNLEEWTKFPGDWDELGYRPDPTNNDTDGDGICDDNDTIPVRLPVGPYPRPVMPVVPGGSAGLNPIFETDLKGDTDLDGYTNWQEFDYSKKFGAIDPTDPDTDIDGMPDGWEIQHAVFDPKLNRPNMLPTDASDKYLDPDQDGVNYSLKRNKAGANISIECEDDKGNNISFIVKPFTITSYDFDGDGKVDPLWENESLGNYDEYLMGYDVDGDGMMENTTNPNTYDSDRDCLSDGYEVFFGDADKDGLPNWYEIVYHLDPNSVDPENGSADDADHDGFNNTAEYRAKPYATNPGPPNGAKYTPTTGRAKEPEQNQAPLPAHVAPEEVKPLGTAPEAAAAVVWTPGRYE